MKTLTFKVSAHRNVRVLNFYWDIYENYKIIEGSFVDNYFDERPLYDYNVYDYDEDFENNWEEGRFSGNLLDLYFPDFF